MTAVTLNVSQPVTLDASGNGTAKVGPLSARETWRPTNVHVSVSTNTNEATCTVYVGDSQTASTFRDSTYSGSSGDMLDGLVDVVSAGWYIFATWTGGDPSATATLVVTGTKDV